MLETSFRLFFFLKAPKNQKSDERYIYLRITVDGISKELSTKRMWSLSRWDQGTGRAKGNKEDALKLNSYLDNLLGIVYSTKSKLMLAGKEITAELLKNHLTGSSIGSACSMCKGKHIGDAVGLGSLRSLLVAISIAYNLDELLWIIRNCI